MPGLNDIIAKMGVDLKKLLPLSMFNLLSEIESKHGISKKRKAELAIEIIGEKTLLTERRYRSVILDFLEKQEAISLLNLLGNVTDSSDPWSTLRSTSFAVGSTNYNVLLTYFGIKSYEKIDSAKKVFPPESIIEPKYPLFPHQIKAIEKVNKFLVSKNNRVLLHMPTGSGKTRTAMNVVANFLRTLEENEEPLIVWIAHSEELCEQACEEFQKAWEHLGNKPIKIHRRFGQFSASLNTIESGILFAGISMLHSRLSSEQTSFIKLAQKVKLIIFDEAHMIMAPTYKTVIEIFDSINKPALLGLSATPGRTTLSSEQNEKFANFFNHQKVILDIPGYSDPIYFLQSAGYIAEVSYISIPYKPKDITLDRLQINQINSGHEIPEQILNKLGIDEQRNLLIINKAMEQADIGKHVIVFACSVESAITISAILCYLGYKSQVVTSSTSPEDRKKYIADYKSGKSQILVNFGVLTTGFDSPKTNVAIIARPTTSLVLYSQMVGRAIRGVRAGGNQQSTIFTVIDQLPGFRDLSKAFMNWEDVWTK